MFWLLVFVLLAGCVVEVNMGSEEKVSGDIMENNSSDVGACAPVEENITEEETEGVYACSAG